MAPGEWVERSNTLMAWAVSATERKATYIGQLPRERTGLACECICPACGGTLQAVNAGKSNAPVSANKTLRPHFRHDVGQQSNGCLVRVAQLAALTLLLEEDTIYLPPPTAHAIIKGASGDLYNGMATGEGVRAIITSRRWIDASQAQITLADGRVVLICLKGSMAPTEQGGVDAVINIEVDDPEVSTWPPEQILARAQLGGDWLCWNRHWQDEELAQQAQAMANEEAERAMDRIPDDLQLPPGLSPLQRSESVLHWHIKNELEAAENLRVPKFKDHVSLRLPNGDTEYLEYGFEESTLRLSNVRLEKSQDGFIPDVMCLAQQLGSSEEAFPLLIEVAVTHRVDDVKLRKIQAAGIACLELDIRLLRQGGRMRSETLRNLLLNDPETKRWLHRPTMEKRRNQAMDQLRKRAQEIQQFQERAEKRREAINRMNPVEALNARLSHVRQYWRGQKPSRQSVVIDDQEHLSDVLARYGWAGMNDPELVGDQGVLWCLEAIRHPSPQGPTAFEVFRDGYQGTISHKRFVTLIGAAITAYKPDMAPEEALRYAEIKEAIKNSLSMGELRFARPQKFDSMVSALYPEMEANLARGVGTDKSAQKIGAARRAAELEAMRQKLAESDAALALVRQEIALANSQEHLGALIHGFTQNYAWMPISGWPSSLEDTHKEAQQSLGKAGTYNGVAWGPVIESGWQAREQGVSLADWFESRKPESTMEARCWQLILEKAWLISRKPT